ncbi:MAG: tRNA epoxyqueuosine(34) reductase QueG [Bacteroidales bacterium]|nr:tRNA epoxyqueuosine(34) reductase QueG [Bacteroidales bacterium]
MHSIQKLSQVIREEALRLGFTDCGFSRAERLPEDADRLKSWLDQGYHARMGYMANHFEKRTDPTLLVESARSVISLLLNYYTDKFQKDPDAPILSQYAYGRDYHFVMKEKMNGLFEFIRSIQPDVAGRVFVDSAPVLDRAWARKAGLGWIGKNSNLISRNAGSFFFIGEIILDLDLEYNAIPESDFCGSCTLCIEACPTRAILDNRTLDSQRCISYQTIENKGEIDSELKGNLANRFFGCDICQDVCPWNRQAIRHQEPGFEPAEDLLEMSREAWNGLDRDEYNRLFRHSAVKRAGLRKLKDTISFLEN